MTSGSKYPTIEQLEKISPGQWEYVVCPDCGEDFPSKDITAIRCPECAKKWNVLQERWKYKLKRTKVQAIETYEEECKYTQSNTIEDRLKRLNNTVVDYMSLQCCDMYGHHTPACKACKQNLSYLSGKPTVNSLCCPDKPVASDGTKYIVKKPYRVVDGVITGGETYELSVQTSAGKAEQLQKET